MPPLPASQAIDAGCDAAASGLVFDQRGPGFPRFLANWSGVAHVDIGACELSGTGSDTVGDGIPDSWRAHYFGGDGTTTNSQSCATCDADGTGQTNLFKFVAGLNPLDGSRFVLKIQSVSGQPSQKNLIFNPIVGGRTYTVQFRASLITGAWAPLTGTTQGDIGNERTVSDPNATGTARFYRVQIAKP